MADDIHDPRHDSVGQPTSTHSLNLCGQGEGKAWKGDRGRFPNPDSEKHDKLEVPKIEGDHDNPGVYIDYAIKIGPRGGRKKVFAGYMLASEHPLSRGNLRDAYAAYAETCCDPKLAAYAKAQAMAKTPQADGLGNKLAAHIDRPRKLRSEPSEPADDGLPSMVLDEPILMHGMDCMCFPCLLKR